MKGIRDMRHLGQISRETVITLLGDSVCIRETPGRVGIVVPWVLLEGLLGFPVSVLPLVPVSFGRRSEAKNFDSVSCTRNKTSGTHDRIEATRPKVSSRGGRPRPLPYILNGKLKNTVLPIEKFSVSCTIQECDNTFCYTSQLKCVF